MKPDVRQPAVAGHFYPDDPAELRRTVEELLESVTPMGEDADAPPPKAIIAPHAGYVYSGPTAAAAYAEVARARTTVERVVLLGPCHALPIHGLALPGGSALATPLGDVPLDEEGVRVAHGLRPVFMLPKAHDGEHSLEVHLPFLQVVLDDFTIVPMVVGDPEPERVAEVLDALWGGPETLVVISSDLSHYQRYPVACELDKATAQAIEALDPASIGYHHACGRVPIIGLLQVARERGLRARRLDLRDSGDTVGSRHRVVGYGAWAFAV